MAEQKTLPGEESVEDFLRAIDEPTKRADSLALNEIFCSITGEVPRLWAGNMIGYGAYRYTYPSGHSGFSFVTGFSPRKSALSIYLHGLMYEKNPLFEKLGKHKMGKGCLYVKKLADIDESVLRKLISESVEAIRNKYGNSLED
jgi:hypothetical protein